jgi:hypothetical protein
VARQHVAVILMLATHPEELAKEFWQYLVASSLHRPQRYAEFIREPGNCARVDNSAHAGAIMPRAQERESSSLVSAWKS